MPRRTETPEQPAEVPFLPQFDLLQSSLPNKPPFCSGTLSTTAEDLLLFYGKDPKACRFLNFTQASSDEVTHLAQTCDVASFGLNQQDVVDESYRKAGKLDGAHFATKFHLENSGLLNIVRDAILEGDQATLPIKAEPYKINVYGPGSFFKAHKDTPRAENMFGSLVLIYPTTHSGGSLVFRDNGDEWTFDSAAAVQVNSVSTPCIGYAAFFADVEHEVLPVQTGYRVTLTYNLYFDNKTNVPASIPAHVPLTYTHTKPKLAFEYVLADPNFLPSGGLLGFGLRRQYPVKTYGYWDRKTVKYPLRDIPLKGTDALLMQSCRELGLNAQLKCLYTEDTDYDIDGVLVDTPYGDFGMVDSDLLYKIYKDAPNMRIVSVMVPNSHGPTDPKRRCVDVGDRKLKDLPGRPRRTVFWVTEPTEYSQATTDYTAYGNEASPALAYGDLCLIVEVGPPGARSIPLPVVDDSKMEDD
ncbi:hypothetical protein EIP91_011437 [Steccherinum ochraceum]|uniref:Fe2OG dioxygenase domain-containing protein n=1 Tax=Steccherinum ochraceum TaxID=92696 RepID=A0A4R0RRS8_9APHY|nr:hypothetical protein EIP91_011437 [Steccherinum ochraceum]